MICLRFALPSGCRIPARTFFGSEDECSRSKRRRRTQTSTMPHPFSRRRQTMSLVPRFSTRVGFGSLGDTSLMTSCAKAAPEIHPTPLQQPTGAIGGLAALGQPRSSAREISATVSGPMVAYSSAAGDGASGKLNPPLYGSSIRKRAIEELLEKEGGVSREALAAKEEELAARQRPVEPTAECTAHAPEAVVLSSPVSVPRKIANALQSGIEGARRLAQGTGRGYRPAWAV